MTNPRYIQLDLFDAPPATPQPQQMAGIFAVGDTVEIQQSGLLYGRRCQIESLNGNIATCTAPGWVVKRTYPITQLKLVRRQKQ